MRKKEAVYPVQQTEAHIVSPVFVMPKSGGGWRLIIDLRYVSQFMHSATTLQDGGSVHAAKCYKSGMAYGKIRLKDMYLTIPMAQESWNFLTFQDIPSHELMQFRCLPFRLCTAPFAFSKTTKPITQFLRQLGIHLIIYVDNLLLAAPTKDQLLVNVSTTLWLFISLGFLINIPKSTTTPTFHLEFLGFVVDTETMKISLPMHKIHSIPKEVSHLLSLKKVPVRALACLIGTLVAMK